MPRTHRPKKPPANAKFSPDRKYAELDGVAWTLHATKGWQRHNIKPLRKTEHPMQRLVLGMAGLKGMVYNMEPAKK